MFDYLIVGAGFAGSVLAERLASQANKKVLVVDKRNHIGGNAYDCYDDAGRLDPQVRPAHLPHQFGRCVRLPVAVHPVATVPASRVGERRRPAGPDPHQSRHHQSAVRHQLHVVRAGGVLPVCSRAARPDPHVRRRGGQPRRPRAVREVLHATTPANNGVSIPRSWTPTVTARVPIRTNRDDRYFSDRFQAMPLHGFTRMFERMLDHPNIKIMLNTDYREVRDIDPAPQHGLHRSGRRVLRQLLRQAAVPLARFQVRDASRAAGAAGRGDQLPERLRLYARHRVQAPHRPGARQEHAGVRVPEGAKAIPTIQS